VGVLQAHDDRQGDGLALARPGVGGGDGDAAHDWLGVVGGEGLGVRGHGDACVARERALRVGGA